VQEVFPMHGAEATVTSALAEERERAGRLGLSIFDRAATAVQNTDFDSDQGDFLLFRCLVAHPWPERMAAQGCIPCVFWAGYSTSLVSTTGSSDPCLICGADGACGGCGSSIRRDWLLMKCVSLPQSSYISPFAGCRSPKSLRRSFNVVTRSFLNNRLCVCG
jgi:hypothetical protein